ncbi:MAG: OmpA family protein, partial [Chlorobi bacterium]|nr:OmpA family protein [Chlorobiota bacterium]
SIPSNPAYPEGLVENRRAELFGNSLSLFAPIVHERFSEYIVERRRIVVALANAPTDVERWELRARYDGVLVGDRRDSGAPPSLLVLNLDSAALLAVASRRVAHDSIECEFEMLTTRGARITTRCAVPVERTQSKFERSRLSLVVFDFDRADLTPTNRQLVRQFLADAVKPTSRIRITGTTDRLGEASYNLELSQARADYVRSFIERSIPLARIEESRGLGASRLLFDNATPEGRYYCRTVTIVVETPLPE